MTSTVLGVITYRSGNAVRKAPRLTFPHTWVQEAQALALGRHYINNYTAAISTLDPLTVRHGKGLQGWPSGGSVRCASMKTWDQVLSSPMKRQVHTQVPVALALWQWNQEDCWGLLAVSLVLGSLRDPVSREDGGEWPTGQLKTLLSFHTWTHTAAHKCAQITHIIDK